MPPVGIRFPGLRCEKCGTTFSVVVEEILPGPQVKCPICGRIFTPAPEILELMSLLDSSGPSQVVKDPNPKKKPQTF